jgi:hypothetical protein
MRNERLIVWVGLLGALCFLHCSEDYPIFEKRDGRFPLRVGNWWILSEERTIDFYPEAPSWINENPWVHRDSVYWEIIDKDILRGYSTYVLKNELLGDESSYSLEWYTDYWGTRHGLYDIGYWNAGASVIPPKASAKYKLVFMDREFKSPQEIFDWARGLRTYKGDSIAVRIPPRKVLEYPLEVGKEWVAFDELWLQTRKVIGRENITTSAGTFLCYKIEVIGEFWKDFLVWYDWFSSEGLVKRYFWYTGDVIDELGNLVGIYESTIIYLLEDYFIH